jgi:hypothetical protein
MRKVKTVSLAALTAIVTGTLLIGGAVPFVAHAQSISAHAQSKYANDTFTVVTRNSGRVDMHVEGRGDHCWATTSSDEHVGITMGDKLCTLWEEGTQGETSLYAQISPNKISFHLDGKSYSTTDDASVKRARSLFDPMVSIEEQQSELGEKQRALGEKQRDLGRLQREVKVQVPDMSADFKKVEADAKRLSADGGSQSDLGDLQSELGDLQSHLGDLQSQAGDQQSKLGDQQSTLGDQQSELGDQQSKLGDQAGEKAGEIAGKLRTMLAQLVQNGSAKPE